MCIMQLETSSTIASSPQWFCNSHTPEKMEYIKEAATLEKALHLYVMGIHQPLIVNNEDGKVTGVLRFGDVFEAIRQRLLNCSAA